MGASHVNRYAMSMIDMAAKLEDVLARNTASRGHEKWVFIGEGCHGVVRLDESLHQEFIDILGEDTILVEAHTPDMFNQVLLDQYVPLRGSEAPELLHFWFGPDANKLSSQWMRNEESKGHPYLIIGRYRWPDPYR